MADMYSASARDLQNRFDSRRLADRLASMFRGTGVLTADQQAFIAAQPMFFLATTDSEGQPQCSFKGGDPGFVRVLDDAQLCFPSYDGNGMFLSLGNVLANPKVGLLFIDFVGRERLRVSGTATIDIDDPLLADYPGARLIVRVQVSEAFPNCNRYIPRMELTETAPHIPAADGSAPVPDWKRARWANDVLPAGDDALAEG